jgi:uncharacterized cupin superfamily protein
MTNTRAETFFPMLGFVIRVVDPGKPTGTYHWETEQEDFLVLAGAGILVVEGEERPLKQWDFVHCPPKTKHAFVGAGDGPLVLLCASSRQFQKDAWGAETRSSCRDGSLVLVDEAAEQVAAAHMKILRRRQSHG